MVLGKPHAGELAVDPREDVGDAIPVALSVRCTLATTLEITRGEVSPVDAAASSKHTLGKPRRKRIQ